MSSEELTPESAYARWAPEASPWSPWVKPVIFTELRGDPPLPAGLDRVEPTWAPDPMVERLDDDDAGYRDAPTRERVAARERFALVVDLPGRASAVEGLALIARGYRPIPLYNGVAKGRMGYRATDIAEALAGGTRLLGPKALPDDAPPAFLLDRERMNGRPMPGEFDARWMVFRQDFPSATKLRAHGVRGVVVRSPEGALAEDLTHVLFDWHRAGLGIQASFRGEPPTAFEPQRPPAYRSLIRRAQVLMGLRRSAGGGFGGLIPLPSSGGGGG
ncbi:MAG: hypothetical protein H6719_29350 [Sandaracinaceae bacterium]|nr:hypothetical protein [Sandaracinaceae bacterium]